MSPKQFQALELWIKAEVEARLQLNNCGPQVNEAKRFLEQRRQEAKDILIDRHLP